MGKNNIGISIYQNKQNPNKFIELKRYPDGHYYWRQYMHWVNEATGADIINYVGGKAFKRVTSSTFIPVLSDYNFIGGNITVRTNKRYFKCYRFIDNKTTIDYWKSNNPQQLLSCYDFIQPLGYHKPKLKEGEVIKE